MQSIPSYESQEVEFKSQFGDNDGHTIKKTLVAFANTFGGDLYIGVNDDGSVVGVEDVHKTEERLWNMVRDNVYPSIVGSVDTDRVMVDGKIVLHVHVRQGPTPPYSLAQDDPRQVFVRVGCTSSPARLEDIAQMIERRNPIPFEKRAAIEQDLTFTACQKICQEQCVKFDPLLNTNFGFWDTKKQLWTNLAYLCADQGQSQMVMIQFRDDDKTVIADSEKVSGSVFLLLEKALAFVARSNYLEMEKPTDGSLERKDHYHVDPSVVRESIVNQLVHRDYSKNVPSTIHVTPSRLEFWSVGGAYDLLPEDILGNMSTSCRNPGLAALLTRLNLMEGLGTGYRLIQTVYKGIPLSRLVRISESSVKISLPRRQVVHLPDFNERQRLVLDAVIENGSVTRRQVQDLIKLSQTSSATLLKDLVQIGALEQEGDGPRTRYVIAPDWQELLNKAKAER
jgi:ATP-dependent DNA helicase RecG